MEKKNNKLSTMSEIAKSTKKVCRIAVGDIYERLTSEELRCLVDRLKEIRSKRMFS